MKICGTCKKKKPLREFSYKSILKGKRSSKCQVCNRVYQKEHFKKNKEYYVNKREAYRRKNLKNIVAYLNSHPCVDCGEGDIVVLDFDHRADKKYSISIMLKNTHSWTSIMKEIEKCDVRCANCHRRKTSKEDKWLKSRLESQ